MFFHDFGFDTIKVIAYNPETRRYKRLGCPVTMITNDAPRGWVVPDALFEKVNMLWKGFVGGDLL